MQNEDWKTPTTQPAPEAKPELTPAQQDAIIKFDKTIDLEGAPVNSVMVVKLNPEDQMYAHNLQMGIIRQVLEPRMELLKEKHLTVLFMGSNDDISILTEEDMGRAGWVKKEQSRIITP